MAEITDQVVELAQDVVSAIQNMMAAMADAPRWRAYEMASEALHANQVASQTLKALVSKQDSLEAIITLNDLGQDELVEMQRLQQACLDQPLATAYLRAQQGLMPLFADVVDVLSQRIGMSFGAACGTTCCSPAAGNGAGNDDNLDLPADLVAAIDSLAETLRLTEAMTRFEQAQERFQAKPASSALWHYFTDAISDLNKEQSRGAVNPATIEQSRHLQRQVREDPVVTEWLQSQQDANALLKKVNEEISQLVGMDFAALAAPSGWSRCCG